MIKQQSARALLWFSFFLVVVGTIITDPAAGFAFIALAGLGALSTIALGDKRLKLIGLLALAVSISLALLADGKKPSGEVSGTGKKGDNREPRSREYIGAAQIRFTLRR